jgi:shikimate dehydrogenase
MRTYGLIGFPLGHSFSAKLFNEKFLHENIEDAQYKLFPLNDIGQLLTLIEQNQISGFNITIPYKQAIIPYLDEIDAEAAAARAVNTVKIETRNNKFFLKGYNTDVYGFNKLLEKQKRPKQYKALILGTGGSSKAVSYVLKQKEIDFSLVSRTPMCDKILSYSGITEKIINEYKLIINTTPMGMFPDVNAFPDIPYSLITKNHCCIDLIYNPEETIFLKKCAAQGAWVCNGMPMLKAQAEASWKIWNE